MSKKPYNKLVDAFAQAANDNLRHWKDRFMDKLEIDISAEFPNMVSVFNPEQDEENRLEFIEVVKRSTEDFDEIYGPDGTGVIEAQTMIDMVRNMFDGLGAHPSIALNRDAYHTACQISDLLEVLSEHMEE